MFGLKLSKGMKQSRVCARCSHVNGACHCDEPVWVAMDKGFGKSIYELRELPFKRIQALKLSLTPQK